jgi:sulfite dehydrogenase
MESTAVAGIHVLGDAVFMGPDVPKTAQMANQQARVAAAAIVQLLQRKPVDAAPVLTDAGYSFVTARDAIHDETVLNYDGATGFYKAAPSPGGVAVVASELEGSHAQAWAKALWADTLGA